ncbi:MAG: hypothetical protein ACTSUL_00765, partial [Promethearchaeota archaeon]
MLPFKPLKIAILVGGYLFDIAGAEKGAQALAESLAKKREVVHVITFYSKKMPKKLNGVYIHPILNRILRKNIRIIRYYINSFSIVIKIIYVCKKYNIQILNVHDNEMLAIFAGIVGKILKIPVIVSWIRTGDIGYRGYDNNPPFKFKIYKLQAKLALILADKILTKGPKPSNFMKYYKVNINKIIHTPNPIKLVKKKRDLYSYQMKNPSLEGDFIVATIAKRMEMSKGIDKLLRTFKII